MRQIIQFGRKPQRPHHRLEDKIKWDLKDWGLNVFICLRRDITGGMLIRRL
jgi:hypothetical protein